MPKIKEKALPFAAELLIMLIPCALTACFYYGVYALLLLLVSVAAAVLTDVLGSLLLYKGLRLTDWCAVITGVCIALTMPGKAPLWLPALASFTAIAAARLPFGDFDKLPFSPPAVGIVFTQVVYPSLFFDYTPVVSGKGVALQALTSMLTQGKSVNMTTPVIINILTGNCTAPIGTGCVLLLAACLVFLLLRHVDEFICSAGFVSVCALMSVLFPRVLSGRRASMLMELSAGMLIFAAVFLLNIPQKRFRSVMWGMMYGMLGGVLCMLLRYFSSFEEGAVTAVLIMNAFSPLFEQKEKSPAKRIDTGKEAV